MCVISDMDDTFLPHGSYHPSREAVANAKQILEDGHQLLFITGRSDHSALRLMLNRLGLQEAGLMTEVENPRLLICDQAPTAIKHRKGTPWKYSGVVNRLQRRYERI